MKKDASYAARERKRAIRRKGSTPTLPEPARTATPYADKNGIAGGSAYGFCVPSEFAEFSLLPEIRDQALSLFAALGIPWHAGVGTGPGNHLLSSQVQCVNALGQMVHEPERIHAAFGKVVDIELVLEVEPGRCLTFEYVGDCNYLNEAVDGRRTRGAHCTSVDAAFLVRSTTGETVLVLVEWKYTESYAPRSPEPKDVVRWTRYAHLWDDPTGPIRTDLVEFGDLLGEPFYQLMRQQMLAHAIESDPSSGVDRAIVVHVHPAANLAYQHSIHSGTLRAFGSTVDEIWPHLLRHPDRFVVLDSAVFANPAITSHEYAARYGPGCA